MKRQPQPIVLASALFLVSGFAALVYQVIWQRVLGIFSGQHIYSITLIVTAFMAGLGFGSLLAGKLADRLTRRGAVLAFALCELLIGLFALLSPWLYYDVPRTYRARRCFAPADLLGHTLAAAPDPRIW